MLIKVKPGGVNFATHTFAMKKQPSENLTVKKKLSNINLKLTE